MEKEQEAKSPKTKTLNLEKEYIYSGKVLVDIRDTVYNGIPMGLTQVGQQILNLLTQCREVEK